LTDSRRIYIFNSRLTNNYRDIDMSFAFIESHPEEVEQDLFFNDRVLDLVKRFIESALFCENKDPILYGKMNEEVDVLMEIGITAYDGELIRMMIDNHQVMPTGVQLLIWSAAELKEASFNELN